MNKASLANNIFSKKVFDKSDLEKFLYDFDRLIVFNRPCSKECEEIIELCTQSELLNDDKILLWIVSDNEYEQQNYNMIYSIYHTYQFTDKIHIISDEQQFGSILNYVYTDVITRKELSEILFHKGWINNG